MTERPTETPRGSWRIRPPLKGGWPNTPRPNPSFEGSFAPFLIVPLACNKQHTCEATVRTLFEHENDPIQKDEVVMDPKEPRRLMALHLGGSAERFLGSFESITISFS
ncbi:hypothetical protein CRG98_019977 [Punica granatum]|uniref:Uncharacterized protein n=1 Tax=Punica granatum TaxID=22663 RepID=A0A2I0JUR8_PUNGR|nr:hypothetical protein CRG98_019977 [Punica granatum]